MAALSDARARNEPFPPARRRLALLAIAGITCSIGIVALVSLSTRREMVDSSSRGSLPPATLSQEGGGRRG